MTTAGRILTFLISWRSVKTHFRWCTFCRLVSSTLTFHRHSLGVMHAVGTFCRACISEARAHRLSTPVHAVSWRQSAAAHYENFNQPVPPVHVTSRVQLSMKRRSMNEWRLLVEFRGNNSAGCLKNRHFPRLTSVSCLLTNLLSCVTASSYLFAYHGLLASLYLFTKWAV